MIVPLITKAFNNTIYIQFSSKQILLRYVEKRETLSDEPIIALKTDRKRKKVVAVGKEAQQEQSKDPSNITIHNAFKHPRTFLDNFEIAEATLRYFIYKLVQRKMFVTPLIIFHPTENIEGGVTQIEHRGLVELGASIGARKTYIWTGRTLSDEELVDATFLERSTNQHV